MPLVSSSYKAPLIFRNGYMSTIYMGAIRPLPKIHQNRERLELSDGDFLDLDWSKSKTYKTSRLVILLHGLEGDAQRPYILGSAKTLSMAGFDSCAVNYRGCSGEPNRLYRSYHSGATEDLKSVLAHITQNHTYKEIYLLGYSLGGNLILKYLGAETTFPKSLVGAMAVSAPCDLWDCCQELLKPKNALYSARFKKHLLGKLREKQSQFPDKISDSEIQTIQTLKDFDDVYTSKAHGFRDALDYYTQCSSLTVLDQIQIPTLLLNAKNDSFLGPNCYPDNVATSNPKFFLEITETGGHVGFPSLGKSSYAEQRACDFFNSLLK